MDFSCKYYCCFFCFFHNPQLLLHPLGPSRVCKDKHFRTKGRPPFLEEMSLASSSLRLARVSSSPSAAGRAFRWGIEWLCWSWCAPRAWVSASRWAVFTQTQTQTCTRVISECIHYRLVFAFFFLLYLHTQMSWSVAPHPEAERSTVTPSSFCTGLPAGHTHTDPRSSENQNTGNRERERESEVNR